MNLVNNNIYQILIKPLIALTKIWPSPDFNNTVMVSL